MWEQLVYGLGAVATTALTIRYICKRAPEWDRSAQMALAALAGVFWPPFLLFAALCVAAEIWRPADSRPEWLRRMGFDCPVCRKSAQGKGGPCALHSNPTKPDGPAAYGRETH